MGSGDDGTRFPLLDPVSATGTGRGHLDSFSRVRLLADAYDADDQTRREFTAVLMEIEDVALNFVTTRIERGAPAFIDMWNGLGGRDRFDRKMRWIDDNRSRIDDALTA